MSQSMPTLPRPAAPPEEVRLFIAYFLQEQGIPQSDTQDVAARWKIGRGREMGSYDPTIYFEIFGAEHGWILYREVKVRIHVEKRRKFAYKYGSELFTTGLVGFTASMVYIRLCETSDLSLHLAIFAAFIGAVALFVWVIVILINGTTKANIESDLRDCRKSFGAKKE
ncbi:hypothetical protein MBLNU13_g03474t1 [Cladosporium sp. NU13]